MSEEGNLKTESHPTPVRAEETCTSTLKKYISKVVLKNV